MCFSKVPVGFLSFSYAVHAIRFLKEKDTFDSETLCARETKPFLERRKNEQIDY